MCASAFKKNNALDLDSKEFCVHTSFLPLVLLVGQLIFNSQFRSGERDCPGGKAPALHEAKSSSIPGTTYSSLSPEPGQEKKKKQKP